MIKEILLSEKIINSGFFLQMPLISQCLYFHLALRADDEFIADAYPVMKAIGASEDDLKILEERMYIEVMNDYFVVRFVETYDTN